MKRLAFLAVFLFLNFAALGQRPKLNNVINLKNNAQSFASQLKWLETKTGFYFSYNPEMIPKKNVAINSRFTSVRDFFDEFFPSYGLNWRITANDIIVLSPSDNPKKSNFTLNGFVMQKNSREKLVNANVFYLNKPIGTNSNEKGYFSISLSEDTIVLIISHVGFKSIIDTIISNRNYIKNYELELNDPMIPSTLKIEILNYQTFIQGQTDVITVYDNKYKMLPYLFGEPDAIKALSFYPGVIGGSEGLFGLNIRGGSNDQNLVLFDGVPVYNSSHMFGIFSILNEDIVKQISLYKGAFSPKYSGRLSSVIDVHTKEGNLNSYKSSVSIGLITSRGTFEGPIKRGKSSFIVSARRSNVDFLAKPFYQLFSTNTNVQDFRTSYYFFDVNARINYNFGFKSKLVASIYTGQDVTSITSNLNSVNDSIKKKEKKKQGTKWGNTVGSVEYSRKILRKTLFVSKVYYSRYRYNFNEFLNQSYVYNNKPDLNLDLQYEFKSGIRDLGASANFDTRFNNVISFNSGVGVVQHLFNPGIKYFSNKINDSNSGFTFGDEKSLAREFFQFLEVKFNFEQRLRLNVGFNQTLFATKTRYYYQFQPRIYLKYQLAKFFWLSGGYSKMQQFFHLLTNPSIGLPSDLWVPSTDSIKPEIAETFHVGCAVSKNGFLFSAELYQKTLSNLLEYKENANYLVSNQNWEKTIAQGSGFAKGLELFAEKLSGNTTGWISYTWQQNNRQFKEINNGKSFPYRYDRRHNVSVVAVHKYNKKVNFSAAWTFSTGFAVTLPTEVYISPTPQNPVQEIYVYGPRNGYRTKANHRLDVGVNLIKEYTWGTRTWSLGLFNAYNRLNPFYLQLAFNNKGERTLYQVSLLPILPNINLKFSFK